MSTVEFFNETKEEIKEIDQLEKLIDFAINYEKLVNVEFNIIFVDNQTIRKINNEYRHIDRETDVITFALEDHEDIVYENCRILGDVYISLDKAISQAEEYEHSRLRELAFLCIHGFYHLLGYDHMNEEEEKVMFAKQEEVLNGFGITR